MDILLRKCMEIACRWVKKLWLRIIGMEDIVDGKVMTEIGAFKNFI